MDKPMGANDHPVWSQQPTVVSCSPTIAGPETSNGQEWRWDDEHWLQCMDLWNVQTPDTNVKNNTALKAGG